MMAGSGSEKRSQSLAIRAAKMYREGVSLGQIAKIIGIEKARVRARIELGQRLLSLNDPE